jgi:hypothetical protein
MCFLNMIPPPAEPGLQFLARTRLHFLPASCAHKSWKQSHCDGMLVSPTHYVIVAPPTTTTTTTTTTAVWME